MNKQNTNPLQPRLRRLGLHRLAPQHPPLLFRLCTIRPPMLPALRLVGVGDRGVALPPTSAGGGGGDAETVESGVAFRNTFHLPVGFLQSTVSD